MPKENETEESTDFQDQSDESTETEHEEDPEGEEETLDEDSEEQSLDDDLDDQDEESEEEEDQEEELDDADFKDQKNGNFDLKKIEAKLGKSGAEFIRSYKEAQKTTNKVLQEKAALEARISEIEESASGATQQAQLFEKFDFLYKSNPDVRAAIDNALGIGGGRNHTALPPGVDPNDPLYGMFLQQQQMLEQFTNQQRMQQQQAQEQQQRETFRQGLMSAKSEFKALLGRDPSKEELKKISDKMLATGHFNGSEWVPAVFKDELTKRAKQELIESRREKRNLPKMSPKGARPTKTAKPDMKQAFDEAWDKYME